MIFTQESTLLPVPTALWHPMSDEKRNTLCNEWFSHVYIGALNGAHILLRLPIFLHSFSLCSLGCIISINQSSSYRFFLPSVDIYCGVPLGNVSFHIPTSLSLFDGT